MESKLQKDDQNVVPESVSAIVKKFIQHPSVVRVLSVFCLCASIPFAITAAFWFEKSRFLLMWCNVFWVAFMIATFFAVRKLGIQRTFALALLLIALIFLGTSGVWMHLGQGLLVVFNVFWGVVFIGLALLVNPRRESAK